MKERAPDPTTREGLEEILPVVRAAAREAGAIAHRGAFLAKRVEHKGDVDLVTSFDLEAEARIREVLTGAFPFAIVGEERGGEDADGRPLFYVDPIDGTTNYVHGHPFWCVSIGLVVAGTPVLGVVVAPRLGSEHWGILWGDGEGARWATRRRWSTADLAGAPAATEEPCAVSDTATLDAAMLATGFPYDRRASADANFDAFVAIKRQVQAVRRCGSAALDLCLVADGTYDGYWEKKLRPWDVAAGIALVRAAGGRVTDYGGAGGTMLERGEVVATNGRIHDALRDALARVPPLSA